MQRKLVVWVDVALLVAGLLVLGLVALHNAKPGRPQLIVWSCGGNYEALSDFCRGFEQRHNCRVRYTAAPVQFELELTLEGKGQPDVMVGRSGPGWFALKSKGLLELGPVYFAADPFVIITPKDNPAGIKSVFDLGKVDVKVAYSPEAMRPKGMCIGHLMYILSSFKPGLVEEWENNGQAHREACGRLVPLVVAQGKADAAVVPLSLTAYPEVKGKLNTLPIPAKYFLKLKKCRANIPQCAGILKWAKEKQLAHAFIKELEGAEGKKVCDAHGYIHVLDPAVEPYKPLFVVFSPKYMTPMQMKLADLLVQDHILREALRRYAKVINTFGPNKFCAEARYRMGLVLEALDKPEFAKVEYERLLREYPTRGRTEFLGSALEVGQKPVWPSRPESYWVKLARERLQALRGVKRPPRFNTYGLHFKPVHVEEGDPDKNGKREFALGYDLFEAGEYKYAVRDCLKVLSLNSPSRFMPQAQCLAGLAQTRLHRLDLAVMNWLRGEKLYPHGKWNKYAKRAAQRIQSASHPPKAAYMVVDMPGWDNIYDRDDQRCMTYAKMLYNNWLPLEAIKEYTKLIHNIYGPTTFKPRARYQMGVAALRLLRPDVAAYEWRVCKRDYPGTLWADLSDLALEKLKLAEGAVSKSDRELIEAGFKRPLAPQKVTLGKDKGAAKRFFGAEDFRYAKLYEERELVLEYLKVMTVVNISAKHNPFQAAAEFRAAQVLLELGDKAPAIKHLQHLVKTFPKDPFAAKAQALLAKLQTPEAEANAK